MKCYLGIKVGAKIQMTTYDWITEINTKLARRTQTNPKQENRYGHSTHLQRIVNGRKAWSLTQHQMSTRKNKPEEF